MSHPSEALLLAFADHELEGAPLREVEAHVHACDLCRHALRDVEQATAGLAVELALVDLEEPAAWQTVVSAPRVPRPRSASLDVSRAGVATPLAATPRAVRAIRPARSLAPLRWAALLLVVAGGAAAAMTAPQWLSRVVPATTSAPSTEPLPAPSSDAVMSSAAVSILPVAGEATVVLTSAAGASGARVLVDLSDRSDVQVTVSTATSEGATPRFTSADGRLAVQLTGRGAEVRVAIPATMRRARIIHDGATVVTVTDGVVAPDEARAGGVALSAGASARREGAR